jgi:hypothetical protein
MLWQAFACQSICLFDSGWLAAGCWLAGSESSQDSVCLRFAAESENLRSSAWRNQQQIVIGACCCRSGLRDYEIKLNQRSAAILKLRQKQRICKTVPEQQLTLRAILAQNSAEIATGRALGENRPKFNCQLVVNRR